ncbi:MAG: hypothetical protein IIB00_03290, partial [candidate division Zixibacteria bacterium]|nr:hypothetical protein [candidate division Zixibacteria bacterium]
MKKQLALTGIMVLIAATFISYGYNQIAAQVSSDSVSEASDSTNIFEEDKSPEMRTYFVVFLKRGPKWTADMTPEIEKVLEEHWANIDKMYDEGKLAAVGPFQDAEAEGDLAGMMIFRVDSME